MKLNNCFTFRPRRVFHSGRPVTEGASRKFFCAAAIKRFSGRKIKSTRNHSDSARFSDGYAAGYDSPQETENAPRTGLLWLGRLRVQPSLRQGAMPLALL